MKIEPSQLHHSQKILEHFEELREKMLTYFTLDKYIDEKKEEMGIASEMRSEIDTLKMVYENGIDHIRKRHNYE